MTDFARLLRDAAGEPPRPLNMAAVRERATRLGIPRRARIWLGVVLAATGIAVPTGVSLVPSGRQPTEVRTIEGERDMRTIETDADPDQTRQSAPAPATVASDPDTSSKIAPSSMSSPARVSSSPDAIGCHPLMTDPEGDIDNAAVDILKSNTAFDRARNRLTFTHRMDDIPSSPPPGEVLVYIFDFDWDGLKYRVQANVLPTGEEFFFGRDNRTESQWPDTSSTAMNTTGHVDREADTVTIHVGLDDFNGYERSVAADEGMRPAAELKIGSQLTNTRLRAYPYAAGIAPYDTATGCDYTIG